MMSTMMAIERQLKIGHEQGVGLVQWLSCLLEKSEIAVSSPPPASIQVSKKQNVTWSLTRKDLILW